MQRCIASSGHWIDDDFEDQLVISLVSAVMATRNESSVIGRPGSRVVRHAVDYIQAHCADAVRVRDVCESTGIPIRTLDRAFKSHFGVTPKTYINLVRLNRVRSSLSSGISDIRVADIANRWGFWHMGQFARDYKRAFGELPSKTMRTASNTSG